MKNERHVVLSRLVGADWTVYGTGTSRFAAGVASCRRIDAEHVAGSATHRQLIDCRVWVSYSEAMRHPLYRLAIRAYETEKATR